MRIVDDLPDDAVDRADVLALRARVILGHEHPGVISAALMQLVAAHIAGHHGSDSGYHDRLLDAHVKAVRQMIPIYAEVAQRIAQSESGHG